MSSPHHGVHGDPLGALDRMTPVGLDEINAGAELLTRTDRKYIVSIEQLDALVEHVADGCAVLDIGGRRRFAYATTYHDTPGRRLHRDTAHRRPTRFKVRVREYSDSGLAMLEVKEKNRRGRTVKHRADVATFTDAPEESVHGALSPQMRRHVDSVVRTDLTDKLEPAVTVSFRRATLLAAAGDTRCTIDTGLRARTPDGSSVAPDLIVLETKCANHAGEIDRWLWAAGIRPARISKYCTSMAALDPTLPRNHWHRSLDTYFVAG